MKEFICKDSLPLKVNERDDFFLGWNACLDEVNKLPPEEVMPAKYAKNVTYKDTSKEFLCSECDLNLVDYFRRVVENGQIGFERFYFRFCPNCGAKILDAKEVVSCLTE